MKHTPAPWKVSSNEKGNEYSSVITGGQYSGIIAKTELTPYNDLDECEANAKLIAAAPELLEAIQIAQQTILQMGVIIRQLDECDRAIEYWNQDGDYLAISEWDLIQSAIKKAKEG